MNDESPLHPIDRVFSVPFVHRLRFTQDVFDSDQEVLADLLDPGDHQQARVQFWVDSNVMESRPDLRSKISDFSSQRGWYQPVVLAE